MLTHTLTIHNGDEQRQIQVPHGANLRRVLLDAGFSPYAPLTRRANCGGRGLCATCGVWIDSPPPAEHWHDRLAQQFGYPRLSCQIRIAGDMVVRLIPEKKIWGGRRRAAENHDVM
jgi:ferredoxin